MTQSVVKWAVIPIVVPEGWRGAGGEVNRYEPAARLLEARVRVDFERFHEATDTERDALLFDALLRAAAAGRRYRPQAHPVSYEVSRRVRGRLDLYRRRAGVDAVLQEPFKCPGHAVRRVTIHPCPTGDS